MNPNENERRKSARFDTAVDIYFKLAYDLKTKVDFQLVKPQENEQPSEKYSAISKNVSSAGMCFTSDVQLEPGNILSLDVYLPDSKNPVNMTGEVKWSHRPAIEKDDDLGKYETGLKILKVEDKDVQGTIFFDDKYNIEWSLVLESILGEFNNIAKDWQK